MPARERNESWTIQQAADHWINPRTGKKVTVGWVRSLVRRSCDRATGASRPDGPLRGVTMELSGPTPFYRIPPQPFPSLPMGRPARISRRKQIRQRSEQAELSVSVDADALVRARATAKRHRTDLDRVVREVVAGLAAEKTPSELVAELRRIWDRSSGHSGGYRFRREDAYDENRR